jgi:hypothetical protein
MTGELEDWLETEPKAYLVHHADDKALLFDVVGADSLVIFEDFA